MDPVTVGAARDALGDALRVLRFRSRVLCRSELRAPWGFTVGRTEGASFHLVVEGRCHLESERAGGALRLARGDLVLLPHGNSHTVRDTPRSPAITLDDLCA
jgi:hypothetical protein